MPSISQNQKQQVENAYPVKDVLNTTSPTCVPEAPNDLALHMEPSSRTSLASEVFHGLSADHLSRKTKLKVLNLFVSY